MKFIELTLKQIERLAKPQRGLSEEVNDWRSDNWKENVSQRGLPEIMSAQRGGIATQYGALYVARITPEGRQDFGLASLRVVTNNGVASMVNAFLNSFELENYKWHGIGTGSANELPADSALGAECTTALNPDSLRALGTQLAPSANIYQTVATNNVDIDTAVTEHGIFSQQATGGGTLLDRSKFNAVNLQSGDGIQTDYRLTFTAGG